MGCDVFINEPMLGTVVVGPAADIETGISTGLATEGGGGAWVETGFRECGLYRAGAVPFGCGTVVDVRGEARRWSLTYV